jgi:UDP-2,3-diacylglucosamine pyrophosphatase LpxH
MTIVRQVYVISDLHLGGRAPSVGDLGFRMMKHPKELAAFIDQLPSKATATTAVELVINGDFIDFLAHEHADGPRWSSFAYGEGQALAAFEAIASGYDKPVFDALARLVQKCRLTVLLGNHDLELSLPEVRDAFVRQLGDAPAKNVRFLLDGEALEVGDAVIEHGNAHDPANAVDFGGLRYLRARRTRSYLDPADQRRVFTPPPGSDLVARVMNPLKERYAFIDLLKPEGEALFALIAAIEPDARGELGKLAGLIYGVGKNLATRPLEPAHLANISSGSSGGLTAQASTEDPLDALIRNALPAGEGPPKATSPGGPVLTNVSVGSWLASKRGLLASVFTNADKTLAERLPDLRRAFRALEGDPTWNESVETGKRYRSAARSLAAGSRTRRGYRFVVFGHTHHAKKIDLDGLGATYLNSGTWANLLRFPVLSSDELEAKATLLEFAENVRDNAYEEESGTLDDPPGKRLRQIFHPTYVRLDVRDDGRVESADVLAYDWRKDELE